MVSYHDLEWPDKPRMLLSDEQHRKMREQNGAPDIWVVRKAATGEPLGVVSMVGIPDASELHRMRRHPGYEYDTTEGQRKNWDDADEPPEGEGWERNVDAGRNGWDRFDYTEESYWRRKQ